MSRAANPYPAGKNGFTGWRNGYKCAREGVAREWNPYVDPGLRKSWFEGYDAARADIERGEP